MRIHLLDPGLYEPAGHHLDLGLKLARWLAARGHELRVYAHAEVKDEVRKAFAPVAPLQPLFRTGPYLHPQRYDRYAGELMTYQMQSRLLAEDLRSLPDADVWLWPTLMAAQLKACANAGTRARVAGCVHTPVVSEEYPHGTIWWRDALLAAHRSGVRLRLGAFEPEHRYEYLPLTADGAFEVFPCYFEGVPAPAPREKLRTIGFFGHQRVEKGSSLIPALIDALLSQGYQVIVQSSGKEPEPQSRPGLTALGFVPDLAVEIAKCDLVVLPYMPERYRRKGSGILMDALASGVPAVVPFDTTLGRWIDRTGAGTQFVHRQAEPVLGAIEQAQERYPALARAAYQASLMWKAHHGLDRFAQALLGAA